MAVVLHVDMDAFFASVEVLHHPEWRGRPLIVGAGPHERGVVSTCSYEARRFGVRSAMPSRTAYSLCPNAVFVPPHMAIYNEASRRAFEIFGRYSPVVEGVSIDEAFLDITGTVHLHGTAAALGEHLRAAVRDELGLTCSVGIAPNRLLAKIGSEQRKPDGLTVMPFDAAEIAEFLRVQPMRILWGVGKQTEAVLRPYGIATCGDIQRLGPEKLAPILRSTVVAQTLYDYSFGRDSSPVVCEAAPDKSVSREHTFDTDVSDRAVVRAKLLELVGEVGRRFRREKRWAATARIKLRDASFNTSGRQVSLKIPARDDKAFRDAALGLLDEMWPPWTLRTVRLVGFGVTNIIDSPHPKDEPPMLFEDPADTARRKNERLSEALDRLSAKGLL